MYISYLTAHPLLKTIRHTVDYHSSKCSDYSRKGTTGYSVEKHAVYWLHIVEGLVTLVTHRLQVNDTVNPGYTEWTCK